jgi:predicted TIM-barrel fold metal-dependent hydrolase
MIMEQAVLQDSIMKLTFGGAFARFPGLKIICAEGELAWMPYLMSRADKYYASRYRRGHDYDLGMTPSDFLRRQVWMSFIKDPLGLEHYASGDFADRIMWSTDYPHPACFFPNSLQVFAEDFAGVPDDDKRKFAHDNVAELFGFTL